MLRHQWGRCIIFTILFSLACIFILVICSSVNFALKTRRITDNLNEFYTVIISENNNETLYLGVMRTKENFDDFISHSDGYKQILISKFGSQTFECTGSCYCSEKLAYEDTRRNGIPIARTGFKYLVAAVTATIAYQLFSEFFKEDCEKQLSEQCPSKSITSEILECIGFETNTDDEHNKVKKKEYYCRGKCLMGFNLGVRHQFIDDNVEFIKQMKRGCGEYTLENVQIEAESEVRAKLLFTREVLDPYCRETSFYTLYEGEWGNIEKSVCVGCLAFFQNPFVHCS